MTLIFLIHDCLCSTQVPTKVVTNYLMTKDLIQPFGFLSTEPNASPKPGEMERVSLEKVFLCKM